MRNTSETNLSIFPPKPVPPTVFLMKDNNNPTSLVAWEKDLEVILVYLFLSYSICSWLYLHIFQGT